MKPSFLTRTLMTAAFVLGAFALAVAAGTWTAPTSLPPAGNVEAPINVGGDTQTKAGSLFLGGGLNVTGNLLVATGTPSVGKVLTALDSLGTVGWQMPAVSASVPSGSLCGALDYDPGGTNRSVPCGGITLTLTSGSGLTAVGTCPSGYTFTSVSYISSHDYYSCVKN